MDKHVFISMQKESGRIMARFDEPGEGIHMNQDDMNGQEQYKEDFDLIEGGVCFVLADGSERIVFANKKIAALYECDTVEMFMQFCSANYRNLMEEEDYKPLSALGNGHLNHIPISFDYQTKNGHFRKAQGIGTLKDTRFGKAYVLLLFSVEQISSDMQIKDQTGVLGMHDFLKLALKQAEKRVARYEIRSFCPVSFDLTSFKEYNRLYGMHQGNMCIKKIATTITTHFPGALIGHLTADRFVALLPSKDLEVKLEHVCNEVNHYINDDGI